MPTEAMPIEADHSFILDCRIEAGEWPSLEELEALVGQTFNAITQRNPSAILERVKPGSEVSVLFTDDAKIARINESYRGKAAPTNVLSFPQNPPEAQSFHPYLGDIVFASETVYREADLERKPFKHHLQHLLIHGFLHLIGYDHQSDDAAETMESLEIEILDRLGIENPYGELVEE